MPLTSEGRRLLSAWLAAAGYVGLSGALAFLAKRARYFPGQLETMMTFCFSLLPSELSPQLLALQSAVSAVVLPQALSAAGSLKVVVAVGALLSALSTRDLMHMAAEVLSARAGMQADLRAGGIPLVKLGDRPQPLARRLAAVVPLYPLLHKFRIATSTHTYHREGVHRLKLDLMWHKTRLRADAPVFVYIHGGGWITGHRSYSSLPLLYDLAEDGWLVATVNYRLAPMVSLPSQLVDCKRALAWVRRHAHEHGGDGQRLVVGGESAGGHLASVMALTANDPSLQPGFEGDDTQVLACVDLYGVHDLLDSNDAIKEKDPKKGFQQYLERLVMKRRRVDDPEAFKAASPHHLVLRRAAGVLDGDAGDNLATIPPFLCVHGTNDTLVPIADMQHFVEALRVFRSQATGSRMNNAVADVYIETEGGHHAFNFVPSARTLALGDAVLDFCNHVLHVNDTRPAAGAWGVPARL